MIDKFISQAGIDQRHIEKYADEDFSLRLELYTNLLLDEVYEWVYENGGLTGQADYDGLLEHLGLKEPQE